MEKKKLAALIAASLFTSSVVLGGCSKPLDISKNAGGSTAGWEEAEEEGSVESVWDDDTGTYHNYWRTGRGYYMMNNTPYMHQDAVYRQDDPTYGKSAMMKKSAISKNLVQQYGGTAAIAEARRSGRISYHNPMRAWQGTKNIIQNFGGQSSKSGIGSFSNRSSSVGG